MLAARGRQAQRLLRKALAWTWNRLPLDFDSMLAVATESRTPGPVPLNKICDIADWDDPLWQRSLDDLGAMVEPERRHRKEWEFAQGLYGLRQLRALHPDARALGLGCGHEPLIYFFATRLAEVIATDLYEGDFQNGEANPLVLEDPSLFAPFAYPPDALQMRRMDATRIDYPDASFDIVFSFSSLEHFGSRRLQLQSLAEIHRVLRPGGVAVLTTELILNRRGYHWEYFRPAELLDDLVPRSGLVLAGGDFSFRTTRDTFRGLVRIPAEVNRLPHLILERWRTLFTSCSLFLEKPIPPGTPPAAIAPRGEERTVPRQPLLQAAIEPVPLLGTAAPGAEVSLTVGVRNIGRTAWRARSTRGIGHVRLGAQLHDLSGNVVCLDYARAALPADIEPGCRSDVFITLRAPEAPGHYRVVLDMVREGCRWFSQDGTDFTRSFDLAVAGN
jgi:SAM-dependent methyltransferase